MRVHFGLVFGLAVGLAAGLIGLAATGPQGLTVRAQGPPDVSTPASPGQAATVLADGRWLLTGGEGPGGPVAAASLWDPSTGGTTELAASLIRARAWHTATLLPDGSVLIVGGVGADGQVMAATERFDPVTQTFQALAVDLWPRALHTATLLTDGRVLIAGGLSPTGEALGTLELWNFRTGIVEVSSGQLSLVRYGHTATLLPNGVVLLWGGLDQNGNTLDTGEVFDPEGQRVTPVDSFFPPLDAGAPQLEASVPEDGAAEVPVDGLIALRFSKPLRVETLNAETVTLAGDEGLVTAKVVGAEGGMLAFIMPRDPLQHGVTYTLTLGGPTDAIGLPLPVTTIAFTTTRPATQRGGAGSTEPSASPSTVSQSGSAELSKKEAAPADEDWTPTADWRTGRPDSPWQSLPPLQAPAGVTALAGQVLALNGQPLVGIRLRIEEHTARTDTTGRFLFTGLSSGHAELMIDGGSTHGMFEVGVDLVQGKTTALPYTIWLPKIDLAHAVTIPSPTTEEVVITTPKIPGLEVHIPPGTVLRGYDGKIVTRVSITPVPLDRPPFPLQEPERVPLYFTVQPGCSYVENGTGEGVRLIYPNPAHEPVGTRFDFWNYDPEARGWYVYGQGAVTPDGAQVIPDPGVMIYEFTGAMFIPPAYAAATYPPPGCNGECCDPTFGQGEGTGFGGGDSGSCGGGGSGDGSYDGEPVNLATGLFVLRNTDLFLPDVIPIRLTRTYRQNDTRQRPFGQSTTHPYDIFLVGDVSPWTYAELILPDGGRIHYTCQRADGNCDPLSGGAHYEHRYTHTLFYKSSLDWNASRSGWDLTLKNGTVYEFPEAFRQSRTQRAALRAIRDRFGNRLTMSRIPDQSCIGGTRINMSCTTDDTNPTTGCPGATCPGCCTNSNPHVGNLLRITSPNGRWIAFTYNGDLITTATDNAGRQVVYTYDQYNRLIRVDDANIPSRMTTYTYKDTCSGGPNDGMPCTSLSDCPPPSGGFSTCYISDRIQTISSPRRNAECPAPCAQPVTLRIDYYADGTVKQQTLADGVNTYNFSYQMTNRICSNGGTACTTDADCPGAETCVTTSMQTTVTDPRTNQRRVTFSAARYSLTDTRAFGTTVARTVSYERQAGSNLLMSVTEPLPPTCKQRQTRFGYDPSGNGNLLTLTRLSGPCGGTFSTLAQTQFTYEPRFNQLATIQGPLPNQLTTFFYNPADLLAKLTAVTDATNRPFPVSLNGKGQLAWIGDPLGHTTTFTYDGADLVAVTDPTQNTTRRFVDAAGRVRSVTDALGRITRYDYYNDNRLKLVTDPLGGLIRFDYDPNGNLQKVTDGRHSPPAITTYHYDPLNRLDSRTGPLSGVPAEMFAYDGLGNLLTYTDRRGTVTDFKYDELNRRTCAGFGRTGSQPNCQVGGPYESLVTYGYDTGNRLTQAVDSLTGTITRGFDDLDNLTSESTPPRGSVGYSYDAASRRQSMTVTGQPTLTYCYDDANRLQKIVQGTSCAAPTLVSIAYDGAGRRSQVTLPNTNTVAYNYDNASRISSFQYRVAGTVYGLTYSYDAAGNRIQAGSDWARTGLPAAASATYDAAADQLQAWNGGTPFQYDANGNLTSDGSNTYHWNARNQLDQMPPYVLFAYDAFGRRIQQTVGASTTQYLYDGLNPVQELSATNTVTANLLTGLGIDERFSRTASGTRRTLLPDALGSTLALTDDAGSLQTQYIYEPFGQKTLVSGSANNSNPYQFTGRENDGIALYYYRARYYSPTWGRFISEDPIEFSGGSVNLYQYVLDDPTGLVDPSGLAYVQCGNNCPSQWDLLLVSLGPLSLMAPGDAVILGRLWGSGVPGALRALRELENGTLSVPPGIRGPAERYVQQILAKGFQDRAVQQLRLQLIDLLKELGCL